jgi:type VI secretion system protein ImpF
MPTEVDLGLMPSILDRLIDPESAGTAILIGYDTQQMTNAVRRDLEELLNTRQTYSNLPPGYEHVNHSIMAYGLPDLATMEAITSKQREAIAGRIRDIIQRFEPRLREVKVTYHPGESISERSLRYHIEARLNVDPSPDIAFDTVLELASGQYEVKNG